MVCSKNWGIKRVIRTHAYEKNTYENDMYREKGRGEKGPAAPLVSITSLHKLGCGSEAKPKNCVFGFVLLSPCTNFA